MMIPKESTREQLQQVVLALDEECDSRPLLFLVDNTLPILSSLSDSLADHSLEQLVRLHYYPQESVDENNKREELYNDWIRAIGSVSGGIAVGVYDRTVRFNGSTIVIGGVPNDICEYMEGLIVGATDGRVYRVPGEGEGVVSSGKCCSSVQSVAVRGDVVFAGEHDGTISAHNTAHLTPSSQFHGKKSKKKTGKGDKSEYCEVGKAKLHQDCISSIIYSNDLLFTCGHDRRIQLVDQESLQSIHSNLSPSSITAAQMSSSGQICLGHADGTLRLYNHTTASFTHSLRHSSSWISSISTIGNLLAIADHSGQVLVVDQRMINVPVWRQQCSGKVLAVRFSEDGRRLYSGGEECLLREYTII